MMKLGLKINVLFILVIFLFSCKKDKLKGDKEVLIGSWNWEYSNHRYGWCDGLDLEETLNPDTEEENYSLEFLKKGIVKFYEGSDMIQKNRLVFNFFKENGPDAYSFSILLNNEDENFLSGNLNDGLLKINQYPFEGESGCSDYDNYFSKE